ncbi:MAG: DUF2188 domain-containing protein [Puia sp.]
MWSRMEINGQSGVRANERLTLITDTQSEAINAARGIAENQQSDLFIHNRHGQIRERNSYGNDPYPPAG